MKITPAMYDALKSDIVHLILDHAELKKELAELKRELYINHAGGSSTFPFQ